MVEQSTLARGRAAYDRQAWGEARDALRSAGADEDLDVADLERLAVATYLTGRHDEAIATLERLHHRLLDEGDVTHAVRWAVWLTLLLALRGDHAPASGWLGRARRLLDTTSADLPERGFVLVPAGLQALGTGDAAGARDLFSEVTNVAQRFGDADLTVLGILGQGQALVAQGEAEDGRVMLDEAMVAVTTAEVSPIIAGIAYCALIMACRDLFDLRRAQEWTAILTRWCDGQEDLYPYRGQCLVHRSEIMQLQGAWSAAMEEVDRACEHLADPPGDPVMGMALYQRAELLRLRGELDRAEQAYRRASEVGHPPHPGLALLRLAQGREADADAAIRREVDAATGDRARRPRLLRARIVISLATGELEDARAAIEELDRFADAFDSVYLRAAAGQARGAWLLASGDAAGACAALRESGRGWTEIDATYELARTRLLMARACRELGDHDTADLELAAARAVFERLGAAPALAEVTELSGGTAAETPGGLTPREVDVLRLVATGATNRQIADRLVISEKTVARHLSNMFTKLGVHSRAAATAWAYEHDLT